MQLTVYTPHIWVYKNEITMSPTPINKIGKVWPQYVTSAKYIDPLLKNWSCASFSFESFTLIMWRSVYPNTEVIKY